MRILITLTVCLAMLLAIPWAMAEDAEKSPTTAPATQPHKYQITYRLSKGAPDWPADKKDAIVQAMDAAVKLYNDHGEFDKQVIANYSPGTPTADGNYNGWMNFGKTFGVRVTLHEISHTLGVGQHPNWQKNIKDGIWQGEHATKLVKEFDGPDAVLHADRQHFWPYGMNYDKEWSEVNQIRHIQMVTALRKDMGIENGKK